MAKRSPLLFRDTAGIVRFLGCRHKNTESRGLSLPAAVKSFNPDGTLLATVFRRWGGRNIGVWDAATGTLRYNLREGNSISYDSVSFSPDFRTMAGYYSILPWDRGVYLWDLTTGERIADLPGIGVSVYSTSFSADGRTLAAGADDGRIYLWNVATQTAENGRSQDMRIPVPMMS